MKQLKYGLVIFLSSLLMVGSLCATAAYAWFFFEGGLSASGHCIFIGTISLLFILSKSIAPLRQKLRDEYEYDENGVSKKYGNFSKLSAEDRKRIEKEKMINAELILDSSTLKSMTKPGSKDPDSDLGKLIGLSNVKESVKEIEARMEFDHENRRKMKNKEKNPMHMVFLGPPGTGKTTTARIMAGILYKYKYIKKNQCIECDGNFFRGLSAGESSQKTKALIQKAKGGVLFIDEAYSLTNQTQGQGQEVIATIVKAMEDDKEDIVFIFAGYDNEMKELVNANPGIQSRVKHYLYFGNYSISDLDSIFFKMAQDAGFCISGELLNAFNDRMLEEQKSKNFGNARTIRNLLDLMIDKHALNYKEERIGKDDKFRLMDVDMPANTGFSL